jgi:cell division protein ZapA
MAGIMIMDEISELTRRVASLEGELDSLRSNRDTALAANSRTEESIAAAIVEVSSQLRGITDKLNGRAPAALN